MNEHDIIKREILVFAAFLPCSAPMLREEDFLTVLPDDDYRAVARELFETSDFVRVDSCIRLSDTAPKQNASWALAQPFFDKVYELLKDALPDRIPAVTCAEKMRVLRNLTQQVAAERPEHPALCDAQAFLDGTDDVNEFASQVPEHIDNLCIVLAAHRIQRDYGCKWQPLMHILKTMAKQIPDIPLPGQQLAYMLLSQLSIYADEDTDAIEYAFMQSQITEERTDSRLANSVASSFLKETLAYVYEDTEDAEKNKTERE